MKIEDKGGDYLSQWARILSGAGLTTAEIDELKSSIRHEIGIVKSRIEGLDKQQVEFIRRLQAHINKVDEKNREELYNLVSLKMFVDFKHEIRRDIATLKEVILELEKRFPLVPIQEEAAIIPQEVLDKSLE